MKMKKTMIDRYQVREEFRKSDAWKEFRQKMYDMYRGMDAITGEPLKEDWNLHHLNLKHSEYTNISNKDNFRPLNKDTHSKVHEYYGDITKDRNKVFDNPLVQCRFEEVLDKMEELNKDNIETILFRNHIDYSFDEHNKAFTCTTAKALGLATDNWGMIYWNPNTPNSDKNQPTNTKQWILYYHEKNGWDKKQAMLALELRHLTLYSSIKNMYKPTVMAKWTNKNRWQATVDTLERELVNTTKFIKQYTIRNG